jgi:hypothetical protein
MRWAVAAGGVIVSAALVTACSGGDVAQTTTTAPADGSLSARAVTEAPSTSTTADSGSTSSQQSSTTSVLERPEYRIVSRVEGLDGDTVVVLLDPTSYAALTDIDLQTIVEDIVERFPPILTMHVLDDQAAADVVVREGEEPTEEGQEILAAHYLVRLEDGIRLVYQGPFAAVGSIIIGS